MTKLYVFVQQRSHEEAKVCASTSEFHATYCCDITETVSAPLCEIDIELPEITSIEAQKILQGTMLGHLMAEREELKADYLEKLRRLEGRIADLQSLEFKKD